MYLFIEKHTNNNKNNRVLHERHLGIFFFFLREGQTAK